MSSHRLAHQYHFCEPRVTQGSPPTSFKMYWFFTYHQQFACKGGHGNDNKSSVSATSYATSYCLCTGLTLAPVQSVVKAVGDGLKDLVEGGLFSAVCTAAAGQPITASFAVQTGEQYTVEVLLAETWCALILGPNTGCHCT